MAGPVAYTRLYRSLSDRWWLAFVLLGLSFVVFGFSSLNLLQLLGANLEFLGMHGLDAVRDGALWQLGGLIVNGVVAAAGYIVLKLCEKVLVERLSMVKNKESDS